jgi:hypothetical protein
MDENSVELRISAGETGETTVRFWYEGQLIEWTRSHGYETIGGVKVAAWVSQRRYGRGGPDMFVKVAVRDGSPEVVELCFTSQPGQSEVRQKHLRAVDVGRLATDLYTYEVTEADADDSPWDYARAERTAEKFIERQRLPRDYRVITDDVLRKVAEVYRQNIGHAPTKAVAKAFGVRDRMASTYVDRARQAGHLPPTKQGQKKA